MSFLVISPFEGGLRGMSSLGAGLNPHPGINPKPGITHHPGMRHPCFMELTSQKELLVHNKNYLEIKPHI
jgi:hypothetical protein